MSEGVASPPGAAAAAEEGAAAAGGGPAAGDGGPEAAAREVRCGDCLVWNRQQTWLCVVPLFIGFVGLGLSLMLLKWIVVGSVQEYLPTELMDSKGIEQDPFFLSKQPTAPPKSGEPTASPGTDAAAAAAAAASRTPNRISTRLTTMTKAPTRFPATRGPVRAVPPRSTTARHTLAPPTVLASTTAAVAVPFSTTLHVARPPPGAPRSPPVPLWPTAAYTTSSYKTYLQDSAPSWTLSPFQEASTTTTTTTTPETSSSPKSHTTTYSIEQSEHFKPCKDKDLAYCLHDGECFVIETLTGSHKHCRCKEGYQGVRCDQFLPKTDSILSDPTHHLGIEFMESEEVYQRQVLSISCIVFGIVIVGTLSAAFYFKTKKQTKYIQEQLKEIQNGKTYSLNASSIMAKTEARAQSQVQLQNYSTTRRHQEPVMGKMMESSFSGTQSFPEALSTDRGGQAAKPHRNFSSCCNAGQQPGMLHRNAFRRTPPLPRGRFNGITGPAYQQLEESKILDQDTGPSQGLSPGLKTSQNASINMQLPSKETSSYFNNTAPRNMVGYSSPRANSVPIIPSVGLDEACMQTQNISDITGIKWCKNSYSTETVNMSAPASSCLIAEQQEVKLLLETVQEQIRILTDSRRPDNFDLSKVKAENRRSGNTAFLPMSPVAKSEREEAQFVLKSEPKRDSASIK
ncbi:pro-neuregulin-3, membrane-bound isoform isoform X1 [Pantherophis guttatus]|uniref:Pro-neuregulin-3, membrane-bound isoform n=2 Tax=Pantherophis guttatus TaxID=94885 RepID=A0A6P9D5J4_PANGU|nr:pro-neuregulin-3, membrane-bound isoform isoform X1 [Pantherophis guttatus]